jgi:hypothetical protein
MLSNSSATASSGSKEWKASWAGQASLVSDPKLVVQFEFAVDLPTESVRFPCPPGPSRRHTGYIIFTSRSLHQLLIPLLAPCLLVVLYASRFIGVWYLNGRGGV